MSLIFIYWHWLYFKVSSPYWGFSPPYTWQQYPCKVSQVPGENFTFFTDALLLQCPAIQTLWLPLSPMAPAPNVLDTRITWEVSQILMFRLHPLSIKSEHLGGVETRRGYFFLKIPGDSKHSNILGTTGLVTGAVRLPKLHGGLWGKWSRSVCPTFSIVICSGVHGLVPSWFSAPHMPFYFLLSSAKDCKPFFLDSFANWVLIKFCQREALAADWKSRERSHFDLLLTLAAAVMSAASSAALEELRASLLAACCGSPGVPLMGSGQW